MPPMGMQHDATCQRRRNYRNRGWFNVCGGSPRLRFRIAEAENLVVAKLEADHRHLQALGVRRGSAVPGISAVAIASWSNANCHPGFWVDGEYLNGSKMH